VAGEEGEVGVFGGGDEEIAGFGAEAVEVFVRRFAEAVDEIVDRFAEGAEYVLKGGVRWLLWLLLLLLSFGGGSGSGTGHE